jgi:hypothetical protein
VQTLFGFISLDTATELISLALVFNKVTGVYGLLAILTGYQLSVLQLSTYIYSIAVLVALIFLIPHIRRQSPFENLALAWLYVADTFVGVIATVAFAIEWYFAMPTSAAETDSLKNVVAEGIENLKQEAAIHGDVVSQETAASMVFIAALTLIRVYFSLVVMANAQQSLQKYVLAAELEGFEVDARNGPFAVELPTGKGRRGDYGRILVSVGRDYWLEPRDHSGQWHTKGMYPDSRRRSDDC